MASICTKCGRMLPTVPSFVRNVQCRQCFTDGWTPGQKRAMTVLQRQQQEAWKGVTPDQVTPLDALLGGCV